MKTSLVTLVVVAVLTMLGAGTAAQTVESIEEERAIAFLKQVQAGNIDSLLAFMHANFIPAEDAEARLARWQKFATLIVNEHSDLQIVGAMADEPHRLDIIIDDPDGPELVFTFEFEAEPPHRMTAIGVDAGRGPGGPDLPEPNFPPGADLPAIIAAVNAWFGELADNDIFSGTALLAEDGEAFYRSAWGKANLRWQVPNRVDTRFDLGSINKSFTRIAIGQLVREGKLTFDDLLVTHLPDYPNKEAAGKITVRHLLQHSSGLGDIFTDRFFNASKSMYRGPRDFFPLFADRPLEFEPGSRSAYSNAGFMVLGAIIEAISGLSYDEYVAQYIFEPSGMSNSGFFAGDIPVPNVAQGYTAREGLRYSNIYMLPARGNSAGSAHSTIDDLLAFDNALREYRLLPPDYTDWYFGGPEPESGTATNDNASRATVAIGIAGGAPGVSSSLESDGFLTVIVLSNYDMPIAESIARALYRPLARALAGKP